MKWTTRNKVIVIVVVIIVVIAVIYSSNYIPRLFKKPLPQVIANNAIVNKTVSGHFWNTSNSRSSPWYINATSSFTYNNITSNLTARGWFLSYGPSPGGFGQVELVGYLYVYGNISYLLHPTGGRAYISVAGENSTTVEVISGGVKTGGNLSANVTSGLSGATGVIYGFQNYKLINQTKAEGYNQFYFTFGTILGFSAPSNHSELSYLITYSVSLSGFADPVNVSINLTYIDVY